MMSNTLLTGAASAAAFKVKNCFDAQNLVLGDYQPIPAMSGLYALPSPDSPSYIRDLISFCLEKDISQIYPIRRAEAKALLAAILLLEEYGIHLGLPEQVDFNDIPVFKSNGSRKIYKDSLGVFWQIEQNQTFIFLCD